ncbi:hypothetical protein [Aporhodopirellula aestuarii]|uniref:Secreted protein n=1 Tax=Aporhodopirellula aestuarii TaxID=2950107 RepID=A0ABT0U737_9BACT|nr:hypothetical protein [Aporhodopirellula aestuarii]MCM2372161.1 hypothetical protein [Aporhodopirellula aestuarii]
MKLHWIASTSLSLVRAVQSCAAPNFHAHAATAGGRKSVGGFALKDAQATSQFISEAERLSERLISAAVSERMFWDHLSDELVSAGNDAPITPQACEVALLRSGHSQLQSDQTAAAIHRSIDNCRRMLAADSPRFADQLRLRYAPLKQAYEAYGPGMVRSIGKRIWNGAPPKNWWPNRVTVHAVQPLRTGAAGRSSYQCCVWIEAVLTDISPSVPEWLRLVYQITQIAIDSHTRTHASTGVAGPNAPQGLGAAKPGGGSSVSSAADTTVDFESKPNLELPWSIGCIPLVLSQAADIGLLAGDRLPIAEALDLWWSSEESSSLDSASSDWAVGKGFDETAETLERWWIEFGSESKAFPIALKQLAKMFAEPAERKGH